MAVATNWISSFLVTQTFQPLVTTLGGGSIISTNVSDAGYKGEGSAAPIFLFYSLITAIATTFLYRRLPETNKAFA